MKKCGKNDRKIDRYGKNVGSSKNDENADGSKQKRKKRVPTFSNIPTFQKIMLEKMLEQVFLDISRVFSPLPTFQRQVSRAHTYAYACESCEKCVKMTERVGKVLWRLGI